MNTIKITENVYAVDLGATMVGIILYNGYALIVDSGLKDAHAKKIEDALDNILPSEIKAVLHTHTHADHIGGSNYLGRKYNSLNVIPYGEISFAASPDLTHGFVYGGMPPEEIRKRMLNSLPLNNIVSVEDFLKDYNIAKALPTHGHSPYHSCYIIDGVIFIGDALFSPEVIKKHKVLYLWNPEETFKSLDVIASASFNTAVIAHKDVITKEECLNYINNQKNHIISLKNIILSVVDNNSSEDIAVSIADTLAIEISAELWILMLGTVRSYLSWLENEGSICSKYQKRIVWKKV